MVAVHPSPNPSSSAGARLHGVLNVRKPAGWTSHDVVLRLRRVLGIQKIGHAGTLDPAAIGVLPILLGKGTKVANHLLEWSKEYAAVLRLGESTDTQDATGLVLRQASLETVTEDAIRSAVKEFQGEIQQIPPMYSAVKMNGEPLYKAARRGETVTRKSRSVMIYQIEVMDIRGSDVDFVVHCSKGTYIRTLCADIGDRLNVGGHLCWLERRRVGSLHIDDALDIERVTKESWPFFAERSFLTIDEALSFLPAVDIKDRHVPRVMNGASVAWQEVSASLHDDQRAELRDGQAVRVRSPSGKLLAVGRLHGPGSSVRGGESGHVSMETLCVEQ
ncbi:MAG: tRNA pseudouridine(55) synthase TruB [Nitrospirales bacterium]|nr:tRNA pseudouridine(55) synthase TruB [Nitrospirales bacterium]